MRSSRKADSRVVIASGNHLCSNPRVVKEADALSAAGFDVHVLGGAYKSELKKRDALLAEGKAWSYRAAYDLTESAAARLKLKLQRKLGLILWSKARVANPWQIFYGTGRLSRAVARIDADLTIAHWEAAMPAAVRQMRRGKRVGIDMEDWFSEDLLPYARSSRPIGMLSDWERELLSGAHSTCTSEAMGDALVARYGCRRPVAIRNVFPSAERNTLDGGWRDRVGFTGINDPTSPRPEAKPVSVFWYSQTIGPGRGLEELFAAVAHLRGNFEVHLRGDIGGYEGWFDGLLTPQLREKTHTHAVVGNNELLSRISEHDVGFAGERPEPPSRDLTITNKFFQYLQGGLAVVASATAGQKEGASGAPGAVMLYQPGDLDGLKQTLQCLIDDRAKLRAMRAAAWEVSDRLSWENEAPKLVEAVRQALDRRSEN
jgi:glycosyltransferase involved in cell wall biosynthesis